MGLPRRAAASAVPAARGAARLQRRACADARPPTRGGSAFGGEVRGFPRSNPEWRHNRRERLAGVRRSQWAEERAALQRQSAAGAPGSEAGAGGGPEELDADIGELARGAAPPELDADISEAGLEMSADGADGAADAEDPGAQCDAGTWVEGDAVKAPELVVGFHAVTAALTALARRLDRSELYLHPVRDGIDEHWRPGHDEIIALYRSACAKQQVQPRVREVPPSFLSQLVRPHLVVEKKEGSFETFRSGFAGKVVLRCQSLATLPVAQLFDAAGAAEPQQDRGGTVLVATDPGALTRPAYGGLMRSALFFGADGLLVPAPHANVDARLAKASSGASELLPVYRAAQSGLGGVLGALRDAGWNVVAFCPGHQGAPKGQGSIDVALNDLPAALLPGGAAPLRRGAPTVIGILGDGEMWSSSPAVHRAATVECTLGVVVRGRRPPLHFNAAAAVIIEQALPAVRAAAAAGAAAA
eukprot:TRINITY_DN65067_c0_g1_i1.p1 TRINITY_DN65067_c0_g1~~TRINITY_DN65067_c0_g1_i1.p1  ORF type:complete len:498 (+),score=154.48 TRINITY_DN65067_c0_g1_i1:77-1495(+)